MAGETARLVLEPLRAAHAPEMFVLLADRRLYGHVPHDPPASEASLRIRYKRLERRRSPDGRQRWLNWALRRRADGVCVGRVEATACEDGVVWVAYMIGAEFWGHGYATEAMGRLVEGLFAEPGVRRLVATVDTRNAGSMRVLEKLGFERGDMPHPAETIGGMPSDDWEYVLTRG